MKIWKFVFLALVLASCGSSGAYDYCKASCVKYSLCLQPLSDSGVSECADSCVKLAAKQTEDFWIAAKNKVNQMNCQDYAAAVCPNTCTVPSCSSYCK